MRSFRQGRVFGLDPKTPRPLLRKMEDRQMTKPNPKAPEEKGQTKVDPAAARVDNPRPAPRWKPDPALEEDDDDLFNDMPV